MTIKEILAKLKTDAEFDAAGALETLMATTLEKVNNKNTELLSKLKESKTKTDAIPEGFDPNKWKELLELESTVDLSKLKGTEQLDALKLQMETAHKAELKTFGTEKTELTSALEKQLIDNAATTAIIAANGNAELLLPHVKTGLKMVKNDKGEYGAIVIDMSGNEKFSLKTAGEKMGIVEMVEGMKALPSFAPAFASGNSGGGAGGDGQGGEVKNPFDRKGKHYNLTEQAKLENTNPTLATQLKNEAAAT